MGISYKKLWHLLLDRDMNKGDLGEACGLANSTMAKLSKGQNVYTDVLAQICDVLDCDISDICEFVRDGYERKTDKK
jgi:DNA-binding Xre family transcriptional regulator